MVTLVHAPNASPMTLSGTNSYVLDCGAGEALVIDPGPALNRHIDALAKAARSRGLRICAILITHGHPDHSAAAAALATQTRAPVYAHPASAVPHSRDLPLDGDLRVGRTVLRTIDAPGHTFDHVVFYLPERRALFTGDTILGEGTSVIAPPGGALRPYQRTLHRLATEFPNAQTIYPGHGPVVNGVQPKIAEYIEHRRERETQVLRALAGQPQTIPQIVRQVYGPQRSVLWPAMARQMPAHLIALEEEGRVRSEPSDRPMTADDAAMLNPRIEQLVGPEEASVIVAELGTEMRLEKLFTYSLI